jgi:hypothetical protein
VQVLVEDELARRLKYHQVADHPTVNRTMVTAARVSNALVVWRIE